MAQAFAQALAQAGVGQPPPNPNPVPPAQAAVFAKTPCGVQAQMGAFIDYTQTSGRKLFEAASKKLKNDLCDCDSDDLQDFLKMLNDGAKQFGWLNDDTGALKIPVGLNAANVEHSNLIEEHGIASMERIESHENAHVNV